MNGFLFTSKTTGVIAQTLLDFRLHSAVAAPNIFVFLEVLLYKRCSISPVPVTIGPTLQGQMGIPNSSCLLPEPCMIHHN
jgi:hypothetical protein